MNRRSAAIFLWVALGAFGAFALGPEGEQGPPHSHPPTAEDVRRVAEFLRSQGDAQLADELQARQQAFPEAPEGEGPGERWRRGRPGDEKGPYWGNPEGKSPDGPFEVLMRTRRVHEELIRLENRRLQLEAHPNAEEQKAYDQALAEWASASRPQLAAARERVRQMLDSSEESQPVRPGARMLGKELRARLTDLESWLAELPADDQALADGLRQRLERVIVSMPAPSGVGAASDERRAVRLQREIDLLRSRLDVLEQELQGVRERTPAPDGAMPVPTTPEAAGERGVQRRAAPLPPLPPVDQPR